MVVSPASVSPSTGSRRTLCELQMEYWSNIGTSLRTKSASKNQKVDGQCLAQSSLNDPAVRRHGLVQRLSCSRNGKFQGIRRETVAFNWLTVFSFWRRKA